MKPKIQSSGEFAPNASDAAEIKALGGVGKLLDYYEHLLDAVKAKSTPEADAYRPIAVSQLRAAKPFLFAISAMDRPSRAEFASADWSKLAPMDSRKALADRAT